VPEPQPVPEALPPFDVLQPRQWEAVYLYAGLEKRKIAEIAALMSISPNTVSSYLKAACLKLGLPERKSLGALFIRTYWQPKEMNLNSYESCAEPSCPIRGGGSPPCRLRGCSVSATG
jgi:DNA-binding CsgD family transcriptional regulator